jgi:hypothetical protein
MKDEAAFSNIHWSNNRLTFALSSSLECSNGLTFFLPARHGLPKIRVITVNGKETPFRTSHIKGYEYALITVNAGSNYRISAEYR